MDEPARRRGIGHDRNAARYTGGGGAGARRTLQRSIAVFRHAVCAAGDAGADLGAFSVVAVRGAERRARGAAVKPPSLRAKRSNPSLTCGAMDCFVASLLAMTLKDNVHDFTAPAVSPPTM